MKTKNRRNKSPRTFTNRLAFLERLEVRKLMAADLGIAGHYDTDDVAAEVSVTRQNSPSARLAPRIVNGQLTSSFAAVGIVNQGCTGTLISPTHVLTAAHCTTGMTAGEMSFEVGGRTYQVQSFTNHPRYNDNDFGAGYDIAILKLSEPVTGIDPHAIFRGTPAVGDTLTLVGFGEGGASDGNATYDFGNKRVGETAIDELNQTHIAWRFDSHNEANTAPGDSGGPAFLLVGGEFQVAGITSGGDGDAHRLGDYSFDTRVDTLADWIDGIVSNVGGNPGNGGPGNGDPGNGDEGEQPDDDHVDVIGNEATPIIIDEFGGFGDGVLEQSGDQDVFAVDLSEGGTYEIYLESAFEDIDTAITLSDSDGNTIAQASEIGSLADSQIWIDLDAGQYYISVGAAGSNDTGEYYLDIYQSATGFGVGDDIGQTDDPWIDFGNAADDELDHACDVNRDGHVTALDALQVINGLNDANWLAERGSTKQFDVNQDGAITPIDALTVINWLNRPIDSVASASKRIINADRVETNQVQVPMIVSAHANRQEDDYDEAFADNVDWVTEACTS